MQVLAQMEDMRAAAAASSTQSIEHRQRIAALEAESSILRIDCERASASAATAQLAADEASGHASDAERNAEKLEQSNAELTARCERLSTTCGRQEGELAELYAEQCSSRTQYKALQRALAAAQVENTKVAHGLHDALAAADDGNPDVQPVSLDFDAFAMLERATSVLQALCATRDANASEITHLRQSTQEAATKQVELQSECVRERVHAVEFLSLLLLQSDLRYHISACGITQQGMCNKTPGQLHSLCRTTACRPTKLLSYTRQVSSAVPSLHVRCSRQRATAMQLARRQPRRQPLRSNASRWRRRQWRRRGSRRRAYSGTLPCWKRCRLRCGWLVTATCSQVWGDVTMHRAAFTSTLPQCADLCECTQLVAYWYLLESSTCLVIYVPDGLLCAGAGEIGHVTPQVNGAADDHLPPAARPATTSVSADVSTAAVARLLEPLAAGSAAASDVAAAVARDVQAALSVAGRAPASAKTGGASSTLSHSNGPCTGAADICASAGGDQEPGNSSTLKAEGQQLHKRIAGVAARVATAAAGALSEAADGAEQISALEATLVALGVYRAHEDGSAAAVPSASETGHRTALASGAPAADVTVPDSAQQGAFSTERSALQRSSRGGSESAAVAITLQLAALRAQLRDTELRLSEQRSASTQEAQRSTSKIQALRGELGKAVTDRRAPGAGVASCAHPVC